VNRAVHAGRLRIIKVFSSTKPLGERLPEDRTGRILQRPIPKSTALPSDFSQMRGSARDLTLWERFGDYRQVNVPRTLPTDGVSRHLFKRSPGRKWPPSLRAILVPQVSTPRPLLISPLFGLSVAECRSGTHRRQAGFLLPAIIGTRRCYCDLLVVVELVVVPPLAGQSRFSREFPNRPLALACRYPSW
jgi:hypothetical protein